MARTFVLGNVRRGGLLAIAAAVLFGLSTPAAKAIAGNVALLPLAGLPAPAKSAVPHALMQARARALMDRTDQALMRLQGLATARSSATDLARLATLYAGAQASILLRDFEQAAQTIDAGEALVRSHFAKEPEAVRQFALLRVSMLAERGGPAAQFGPALASALEPLANDRSRPVMIVRAQALMERNPRPTEEEVRAHLAPNLCRCGTHMRILRAVRRAAEMMGGGVRDVAEYEP